MLRIMKNSDVLITGGTGFIGSNFLENNKDLNIVNIDKLTLFKN